MDSPRGPRQNFSQVSRRRSDADHSASPPAPSARRDQSWRPVQRGPFTTVDRRTLRSFGPEGAGPGPTRRKGSTVIKLPVIRPEPVPAQRPRRPRSRTDTRHVQRRAPAGLTLTPPLPTSGFDSVLPLPTSPSLLRGPRGAPILAPQTPHVHQSAPRADWLSSSPSALTSPQGITTRPRRIPYLRGVFYSLRRPRPRPRHTYTEAARVRPPDDDQGLSPAHGPRSHLTVRRTTHTAPGAPS